MSLLKEFHCTQITDNLNLKDLSVAEQQTCSYRTITIFNLNQNRASDAKNKSFEFTY